MQWYNYGAVHKWRLPFFEIINISPPPSYVFHYFSIPVIHCNVWEASLIELHSRNIRRDKSRSPHTNPSDRWILRIYLSIKIDSHCIILSSVFITRILRYTIAHALNMFVLGTALNPSSPCSILRECAKAN